MAGIYIHFPFCMQKCNYCNFFSLATTRFRDEFFTALLKEIELTRDYLGDEPVETIYFGGGTPSLFSVKQLEEILKGMRDKGKFSAANGQLPTANFYPQEVTLEMNPDDVTFKYMELLRKSPINRISLGIQSFFDEDLQYLGRSHDAKQANRAIELIRDAGYEMRDKGGGTNFEFLSIDLIYGIPTLTNDRWKSNLQRVIDLGIPHLSAYALTVEEKTPLAWMIKKGTGRRANPTPGPSPEREGNIRDPGSGIREPVSDEQAAEQFEILMEIMEQAGYIQYEISNFCLPGYESRHNSNYWRGAPYLGLGPSAHSFNGTSRRWNPSHLTSYILHLTSDKLIFEEEQLSPTQQYNEYVMTSLRTIWGCDPGVIEKRFGKEQAGYFSHQAIRHLASGHMEESEGVYQLTRKGKFLADGISADLFYPES